MAHQYPDKRPSEVLSEILREIPVIQWEFLENEADAQLTWAVMLNGSEAACFVQGLKLQAEELGFITGA